MLTTTGGRQEACTTAPSAGRPGNPPEMPDAARAVPNAEESP